VATSLLPVDGLEAVGSEPEHGDGIEKTVKTIEMVDYLSPVALSQG